MASNFSQNAPSLQAMVRRRRSSVSSCAPRNLLQVS